MQYRVVRYTTAAHEVVVEEICTRSDATRIMAKIQEEKDLSDDTEYGIEEYEES